MSSLWFQCVYVDPPKNKAIKNQIITQDEMFDLDPKRHTFTPSRVTVCAATMSCFCSVCVFLFFLSSRCCFCGDFSFWKQTREMFSQDFAEAFWWLHRAILVVKKKKKTKKTKTLLQLN